VIELARVIEHFPAVRLTDIEKLTSSVHSSGSRRELIGHRGEAYIMESEHRHPGSRYLYFTNHSTVRYSTGYGSYTVERDRLIMKTHHSIYRFEIL